MEKYTLYITFEENYKIDETHEKILNLALPNILDYKKRFPEVEIKYINSIYRFEEANDNILDSLLKDICVHCKDNFPKNIDTIYGWQVTAVDEAVKYFHKNKKDYLEKRLKNYTPILGNFERENKFIIQTSNVYLIDL